MNSEDIVAARAKDQAQQMESNFNQFLSQFNLKPIPSDLLALLEHKEYLTQEIQKLNNVVLTKPAVDVDSIFRDAIMQEQSAVTNTYSSEVAEVTAEQAKLTEEVESYNQECLSKNNAKIENIKSKQKELDSMRPQLKRLFTRYSVTMSDLDVHDNVSESDMLTLLDDSTKIAHELTSTKTLSGFLKPGEEIEPVRVIGLCCVAAIALYVLSPIVAIALMVYFIKKAKRVSEDTERLRICAALLAETDYNRFIKEDDLLDLMEVPSLQDEIDDINEEYQKQLNVIDQKYSSELEERRSALQGLAGDIIGVTVTQLSDKLTQLKTEYNDALTLTQEAIDDLMVDYKPFPSKCNKSGVMSNKYVYARKFNVIDVEATVPAANFIFVLNKDGDRTALVNTLKLHLANIILSVQPKALDISIFDPIYQGAEFSEFFQNDTKDYIHLEQKEKDYRSFLHKFDKELQQNLAKLQHKSIDEFNVNAEANELVPMPYKLLICASSVTHDDSNDGKKPRNEVELDEFLAYSRNAGVIIWMIDDRPHPNCITIKEQLDIPDGDPIKYDIGLGVQAMQTYAEALKNYRDKGIDYEVKFRQKFIPKEKWWTWDTIKGIELNFGLQDDDPTKGFPMVLGDSNVHAIMGGETGAGKSAAINQMLVSLALKYPPSELVITYVDFKNVEAAKFTKGIDKDGNWMSEEQTLELNKQDKYFKRISYIPHFNIISGTTDGGYAKSLFDYFLQEMGKRRQLLSRHNEVKVEDLRKHTLQKYNAEHNTPNGTWADMRKNWEWYKPNIIDEGLELPRYLIICDEFQVMFNDQIVDSKTQNAINGLITALAKLARAMGCHLWFTSQSMSGTMSKDTMGNFTLRAALRCSDVVSQELLGNDASSKIMQKFGFMYTNDSGGKSPNANRLWRVPFLDAADINGYIDQLWEMLPERNEQSRNAEFFDEKTYPDTEVLDNWYEKYPEAFASPKTFILGERAEYSSNLAPITLTVTNASAENIIICGFEMADLINNTLTLLYNLKHKGDKVITIISCLDRAFYRAINPSKFVAPKFLELADPDVDCAELFKTIERMINNRMDDPEKERPEVYVFLCLWEAAPGVVTGAGFAMEAIINNVLRNGPKVGVHIVWVFKSKGDLARSMVAANSHKIASSMVNDAVFFVDCATAVEKLPVSQGSVREPNFSIYELGSNNQKFKIYHHKLDQEQESRDVVI